MKNLIVSYIGAIDDCNKNRGIKTKFMVNLLFKFSPFFNWQDGFKVHLIYPFFFTVFGIIFLMTRIEVLGSEQEQDIMHLQAIRRIAAVRLNPL